LVTRDGALVGTPAYMSPEQARGEAVDAQTDIWALGCVLYEMLSGQRAFKGASASAALASVLHDAVDWPPLPPVAPPGLRRLLARCLGKAPPDRLPSMADVRIALEDGLDEAPQSAARVSAPAARGVSRSVWRAWAAVAVVVVALGAYRYG